MDSDKALKVLQDRRRIVNELRTRLSDAECAIDNAFQTYCDSLEDVVKSLLPGLTWARPLGNKHNTCLRAKVSDGPLKTIILNVLERSYSRRVRIGNVYVQFINEFNFRPLSKNSVVEIEVPVDFLKGLGIQIIRQPNQEQRKLMKMIKKSGIDSDGLEKLLQQRKRT